MRLFLDFELAGWMEETLVNPQDLSEAAMMNAMIKSERHGSL